MRKPRLSLRAMMVVVAVAALTLTASARRRRDFCLRRAQVHSEYRELAESSRYSSIFQPDLGPRHAEMAARYRRLADRPWERLPEGDDAVDFMVGGR